MYTGEPPASSAALRSVLIVYMPSPACAGSSTSVTGCSAKYARWRSERSTSLVCLSYSKPVAESIEVSAAAMPANAQHACHGDWLFTGVTKPSLRRSYLLGRADCAVSAEALEPSSTAHSGTSLIAVAPTVSPSCATRALATPGATASENANAIEVTTATGFLYFQRSLMNFSYHL